MASVSLCSGFPARPGVRPVGLIKATAEGHGLRSCFLQPEPTLAAFDAEWFVNLCVAARSIDDVHAILRMLHEGLSCTSSVLVQVGSGRRSNIMELRVDTADPLARDITARRLSDDAVMAASEKQMTGFRWSELDQIIDLNHRRRETLDIYADHGLHEGYTVSFRAPEEPWGFASFAFREPGQLTDAVGAIISMAAPTLYETSRRVRGLWHERTQKADLTPRQADCLTGVARGLNDAQIAHALGISLQTVYDHVEAARARYRARKRADLIVKAIRAGDLQWSRITGPQWTRPYWTSANDGTRLDELGRV